MDDLLSEFLTETTESLEVLDSELVRLEQNPNDPELLGNIFRIVHTIKGTCGFLGLPRLEAVAHAGENVLGKVRDNEIEVTPEVVSLVLKALDQIKAILSTLEQTESEPDGDDAELIAALNAIADGGSAAGGDAPAKPAPEMPPQPDIDFEPVKAVVRQEAPEPAAAPEPAPAELAPAPAPAPQADPGDGAPRESAVAAQSIRVNVDLLENLMNMVSELVLTRNQLMQILRNLKESEFGAPLQRLNHVTSELQESVMKTRMQPVGNAWAKLPRMIRDLSLDLNKKIDLQMYGADTELDRQVLELIKDPLAHMVRNSADHGLEPTEDRILAGKPEVGRVTLNAFHQGGHIIIEISDDGKGLNLHRIKEKCVQNRLATEAELATMTDHQIGMFIFKPGFSTAAAVTSVSGRGVGMDVVRTNIEKIGGTVDLKSVDGRGSTFTIKIPLTLAIVNALIVECGGERFAIPQLSVNELVRTSSNSEHKIEHIKDTPVLRLRDRLLPLVSLRALLKLDKPTSADGGEEAFSPMDEKPSEEMFIVVTQVGAYTFGLIVDRVFDTEEIVVKPVAPILRHISLFSGNTILGDGRVIMILDPNGIATETGEVNVAGSDMAAREQKTAAKTDDQSALLLFHAGGKAPKAVPLALVARLEEVDLSTVEYSDGKPVVQYRDRLMPLVPIDPAYDIPLEGVRPVLVFSDRDYTMGLVVDEIVDIVEEKMNVQLAGERPGLLGSAIVAGHATEVIDAGYYLTLAFNDWFDLGGSNIDRDQGGGRRVLLVDDSPFFRNLLNPLLTVAGYNVVSVESGAEALTMCENGEKFDAIISDIQMPEMDGFALATAIRSDGAWKDVPMIALSGQASEADMSKGREVGFNDYVAKFDREGLLQTLQQCIGELGGSA